MIWIKDNALARPAAWGKAEREIRMYGFTESSQAWDLTQGMARLAGVNLPSAVIEGWLTRGELARLVGQCQACTQSQPCQRWLAVAGRGALPNCCPNKPVIEALAIA